MLWVADEVQCGYGRTGRFYAFEHYGVVPDVTALAKSLGGGKAAVGAMIASRDVYMKAYGTPKTAMIHAPATFGGIGEACVTAIEALNVLYDEGLIDNAADDGRLSAVAPEGDPGEISQASIKDVRGQGLMVGLEFHDFSRTLPMALRPVVAMLDDKLKGSLSGFVGALLLRDYDVLVAFTEYNRNVIRLEPPLICGASMSTSSATPSTAACPRHRLDRQGLHQGLCSRQVSAPRRRRLARIHAGAGTDNAIRIRHDRIGDRRARDGGRNSLNPRCETTAEPGRPPECSHVSHRPHPQAGARRQFRNAVDPTDMRYEITEVFVGK